MDVLDLLKNEDDNPRGQGSRFRGGNTLEEAGEAEQRRRDIQAMRWSLTKQEAGIVYLIQAKNFFLRLQLPEPRRNEAGEVTWTCSEAALQRAYDQAKMCCDPEWAHHPQRDRGFALLTDAMDTLSDRNGKRDEYVRQITAEVEERDARLKAQYEAEGAPDKDHHGHAKMTASWSKEVTAKDNSAAEVAAELEEQMAARRRRMRELELEKALKHKRSGAAKREPGPQRLQPGPQRPAGPQPPGPQRPPGPSTAPGPQRPTSKLVRPAERDGLGDDDDDDDDEPSNRGEARRAEPKAKKKRRPGMF